MGIDVGFRVIGFPTAQIGIQELQELVKICLQGCDFATSTITYSGPNDEKNYSGEKFLKNIPGVLQEILVFCEVTGTITQQPGNSKYLHFTNFILKWISRCKNIFPLDHAPWLVMSDNQAFKRARNRYVQHFDDTFISIGTLKSSSSFVPHQTIEANVYFYHDTRTFKVEYYFLSKILILSYSNFRHILVNGNKLLIVFSNSPIVRNMDATERPSPEPIHREILGKSNGILLTVPSAEILSETLRRLNFRSSQLPIAFVPYKIEPPEVPPSNVESQARNIGFSCRYLVEGLIRQKYLLQLQDIGNFLHLVRSLHSTNRDILERALTDLLLATEQGYPVDFQRSLEIWFKSLLNKEDTQTLFSFIPSRTKLIRRVVITPTRILLWPKEVIIENRILRNFNPDFSLRVSFRDDDYVKLNNRLPLSEGVKDFGIRFPMQNGLEIAGRKYEFLAWSNSQIRDHSVWMYAKDDENETAASIRRWMGDFSSINVVAKYMSRMGQCFSQTSDAGIPMDSPYVGFQRDIRGDLDQETRMPYCFSDGIGKISEATALEVCETLGYPKKTSAFQIRYGGCKGMVVVDPTLTDKKMIIRDSMKKFESPDQRLEIVKHSQAGGVSLNRPMIAILDHLGVNPAVLLRIQEDALQMLTEMLLDSQKAAEYLSHHNNLRGVDIQDAHKCGLDLASEPFFRGMLLARHNYDVTGLRTKARLPIDPSEGRNMFGVLDETGKLRYGEVFVQYTINIIGQQTNRETNILKGRVLITKNPCYLSGDIRIFECVDIPELHHIVDCVVFPQNGPRPHPNEMSGSDLDGDEYTVIWKEELFFRHNRQAGTFPSPISPVLGRVIQPMDMVNFLCDFITNDRIGTIASAHLATSDLLGIDNPDSIKLARNCSLAVDFPKTGFNVNLDKNLRPKKFPDFMEKSYRENYRSKRTLGKLFRVSRDFQTASLPVSNTYEEVKVDQDLVYPGWEKYREEATKSLASYRHLVLQLLSTYGVKHESEAMAGAFSDIHSRFKETKDRYETEELVAIYVKALWKKYANEFIEEFQDVDESPGEDILKKASAWYMVTYLQTNPNILSFPWIVTRHLKKIKLLRLTERQQPTNPDPSPILARLNNELDNQPLPELSYSITLILGSHELPVFADQDYKTLNVGTNVLLHWARNVELTYSPNAARPPREGFMEEKALTRLILHHACSETNDRGVLPFVLSFLRYCISFRFMSGEQKKQRLPFYVGQSGFLSKKAMLSYRDLAVSLNLAALGIGEMSHDMEMEMEPIQIQKQTIGDTNKFAEMLANETGISRQDIEIRSVSRWQYLVSAYGRVGCILALQEILHRGDEYLNHAYHRGYLTKRRRYQ